jgi:rare lipoprotein A
MSGWPRNLSGVLRAVAAASLLAASACETVAPPPPAPPPPAPVAPAPPSPPEPRRYQDEGNASWYGAKHHGEKTASGAAFDKNALTAAHRTLPFDTRLRVTNLENGRTVEVVVNDRGPYVDGRLIDLSEAAARKLGFTEDGVVRVRIEELP